MFWLVFWLVFYLIGVIVAYGMANNYLYVKYGKEYYISYKQEDSPISEYVVSVISWLFPIFVYIGEGFDNRYLNVRYDR